MNESGSKLNTSNLSDSKSSLTKNRADYLYGQYALLMAETKEEAHKWVIALNELSTLFLHSDLKRKDVYLCRELCDAINIPMV